MIHWEQQAEPHFCASSCAVQILSSCHFEVRCDLGFAPGWCTIKALLGPNKRTQRNCWHLFMAYNIPLSFVFVLKGLCLHCRLSITFFFLIFVFPILCPFIYLFIFIVHPLLFQFSFLVILIIQREFYAWRLPRLLCFVWMRKHQLLIDQLGQLQMTSLSFERSFTAAIESHRQRIPYMLI